MIENVLISSHSIESIFFREVEVHEESLSVLRTHHQLSSGGEFSLFLLRKKKEIFPSAALCRLISLQRQKHTTVFVEHLLQLVGNVVRQCSRGLHTGHNHNKASFSPANTSEGGKHEDRIGYVEVCTR